MAGPSERQALGDIIEELGLAHLESLLDERGQVSGDAGVRAAVAAELLKTGAAVHAARRMQRGKGHARAG